MKFHKMIKKLQKKPHRVASSESSGMYKQTIESLQHWFCEDTKKINRVEAYKAAMFATDWVVKESK